MVRGLAGHQLSNKGASPAIDGLGRIPGGSNSCGQLVKYLDGFPQRRVCSWARRYIALVGNRQCVDCTRLTNRPATAASIIGLGNAQLGSNDLDTVIFNFTVICRSHRFLHLRSVACIAQTNVADTRFQICRHLGPGQCSLRAIASCCRTLCALKHAIAVEVYPSGNRARAATHHIGRVGCSSLKHAQRFLLDGPGIFFVGDTSEVITQSILAIGRGGFRIRALRA